MSRPRQRKWDLRFLELASLFATWSKDRSTKVGAVIVDERRRVISAGYNGMPRGVDDNVAFRHAWPEKYKWFSHAEENAILQSPMIVEGCTIYVTVGPCPACARSIIQSGIKTLVTPVPEAWPESFRERWFEDSTQAEMLMEAGVHWREVPL